MRRLAWVVASLALHAGGALAATSLGHASARRGASAMTELSVETEPAPVPVPPPQAVGPEEPSAVAPLRPAHAPQAHIHSYPVPRSHDEQPHDPGLLHVPRPSNATPAARPAEAAVAAPADAPALPKFSLAIVPVAGRAGAQASGGGAGPAAGPEGAPLLESAVSRGARLVSRAGVQYPAEARAAEVEATVALEIVVDRSGSVTEARVVKTAGYGFDAAAVAAVRQYRFAPAERGGQPVSVRMRWTVDFRLH